MNKIDRIIGYDYIRAISIIIVISYHYSCSFDIYSINGFHDYFYSIGNTGYGSIAVCIFLILSGSSLCHNYHYKISTKNFYKKRWINIFPQFYIIWIPLYFLQYFIKETFLWGGDFWKIFLSFIGMDGYFLYLGNNFCIIGEWFLGSIIILYLLYPLLRYLLINNAFISSILFFLLFIYTTFYDIFLVSDYRNLFTCIFCFWMGMIFEKNRTFFIKNNHIILIFCTIAFFLRKKLLTAYIIQFF